MKGKLNPNGISKNEIERGMKLLIESTQGADPVIYILCFSVLKH
jgi:hypothetical protein